MLLLSKSSTTDNVVVTLDEARTIETGWFHFVFTNITTNEQLVVTKSFDDDLSAYKSRYNQFVFNTQALFEQLPAGQYTYDVYESESEEYETGLNLLETGRALIEPSAAATTFTGPQTRTQYAGAE